MKKSCVIVGGGVVAILAAHILSKKYNKVHIIEQSESLGGLLSSKNFNREVYFDYGPHLFTLTGIKKIDEILFGPLAELKSSWLQHNYLYDSNFFKKWNMGSSLIDIKSLPLALYKESLSELIKVKTLNKTDNYNDYIISNFGKTLKINIFDNVINKIYGSVDLDQMSIKSLKVFGLHRVLAFTNEETIKLKEQYIYDERIAFHSFEQDKRNLKFYYPKGEKGVGYWVQKQILDLKRKNIIIHNNNTIQSINFSDQHINSLTLKSGKKLDLDFCLWTVPPALGLKAANIKYQGRIPKTRSNIIFHFEFDKSLINNKSTYLWNWDLSYRTFRVTLYPNLNKKTKKDFSYITVEVLCDYFEQDAINSEQIIKELKILNIIPMDTSCLFDKKEFIRSSFPILTQDYGKQTYELNKVFEESFSNLKTAGRHSGRVWFMNEALIDLYNLIS